VDWRRVSSTLTITHVNQTGDCPSACNLDRPTPLDMEISILPSPEATSAFLVGSFAGTPSYLPRGIYELKLTFDPLQEGLPKLRAGVAVNGPVEQVTMRFVQPRGLDWPLATSWAVLPAGLLEKLIETSSLPGLGPNSEKAFQLYEQYVRPEEAARRRHPPPAQLQTQVLGAKPAQKSSIPGERRPTPGREGRVAATSAKAEAVTKRGARPTASRVSIKARKEAKG
jgi:hypothetical protein